MVKKTVLGCKFKKNCEVEVDEGITEKPFICCAICSVTGGCPDESKQCSEVPDTCCGIITGRDISNEEAARILRERTHRGII